MATGGDGGAKATTISFLVCFTLLFFKRGVGKGVTNVQSMALWLVIPSLTLGCNCLKTSLADSDGI